MLHHKLTRHKRWLHLLLILYVIGIILVSLAPGEIVPVSSARHMDKVGHFIAYTGLGFLLGLTVKNRNGRFLAVLCAIALGFLLEGGQSFVPGREMSLADGIVNTCGVLAGMALFYWQGRGVENYLSNLLTYIQR
jgi:hypothetical protein